MERRRLKSSRVVWLVCISLILSTSCSTSLLNVQDVKERISEKDRAVVFFRYSCAEENWIMLTEGDGSEPDFKKHPAEKQFWCTHEEQRVAESPEYLHKSGELVFLELDPDKTYAFVYHYGPYVIVMNTGGGELTEQQKESLEKNHPFKWESKTLFRTGPVGSVSYWGNHSSRNDKPSKKVKLNYTNVSEDITDFKRVTGYTGEVIYGVQD